MMRRYVFKRLLQQLQISMPFIPLCCPILQERDYNFIKELLLEILKKEVPHKLLVSLLCHEYPETLLWLLLVEMHIIRGFGLLDFVLKEKDKLQF